MNKDVIIGILAVALVVVGGALLMGGRSVCAPANVPQQTAEVAPTPAPVVPSVSGAAQKPVTRTLTIQNFAFDKFATVTVRKGDTIVWVNKDTMAHTVTGDKGGPASQTIPAGGKYSYTFDAVGTFPYHCTIHPNMKATVVVAE